MSYSIQHIISILNGIEKDSIKGVKLYWRLEEHETDVTGFLQLLNLVQSGMSALESNISKWRLILGSVQDSYLRDICFIELNVSSVQPLDFHDIKVTVLPEHHSNKSVINVILRVLPKAEFRLQKLPLDTDRHLILMEYMQQFLQHGRWPHEQGQIDCQTLERSHKNLLIKALYRRWEKEGDKIGILHRLVSYELLAAFRQSKRIEDASLTELIIIAVNDRQLKLNLYSKISQLSMSQLLQRLPISYLLAWQNEPDMEMLIATARRQESKQYENLCQWEKQWALRKAQLLSNWSTYGCWQGQCLWNWFYASSFVGLGAELFAVGNQLLLQNACSATGLRLVGGLLGAAYSYSLDPLCLIKLLSSSYLAQRGQQLAQSYYINDRQARLEPMLKPFIKLTLWHTLISLIFAVIDSYSLGDSQALISLMVSLFFSYMLSVFVIWLFQSPHSPSEQPVTERQWFCSTITSLIGREMGRQLADIGYTAYAQYQNCESAAREFETQAHMSANIVSAKAVCRQNHWFPTFWSGKKPPLKLTWRTVDDEDVSTECTLTSSRYFPIGTGTAICDKPTVHSNNANMLNSQNNLQIR